MRRQMDTNLDFPTLLSPMIRIFKVVKIFVSSATAIFQCVQNDLVNTTVSLFCWLFLCSVCFSLSHEIALIECLHSPLNSSSSTNTSPMIIIALKCETNRRESASMQNVFISFQFILCALYRRMTINSCGEMSCSCPHVSYNIEYAVNVRVGSIARTNLRDKFRDF